ncbi:unnamed protein product [Protopolystoma xenopodis]|uniref:leucine--tRNA ligase n=1 Tax=Protopolystoma xenopodis TaxID=117903 RepID=A0A3S5FDN9_9PLAT|nr:unnamed protein product [Protopolystoma xenopodis]
MWLPLRFCRAYLCETRLSWDTCHDRKKFFILSMFPYPSGNLHMGHLRVYTVADVLARFYRLLGYSVIQPMGWDSFGLPAENAAIDKGALPKEWTYKSQFDSDMLLSINWDKELSTCDPNYYKWTQYIFTQLFHRGLAYQRFAKVNWDPVDETVLADELVDNDGRSWRSGAVVERKSLRQWYFRTSLYSQSLLDSLSTIQGMQWRDVINLQKGWLGSLTHTLVEFDLIPASLPVKKASTQITPSDSAEQSLQGQRISVFHLHPSLIVADAFDFLSVGPDSPYWSEKFRRVSSLYYTIFIL